MASIFPECDQLKQNYDKCFTEFFQKFIAPNYRHKYAVNPCDRLHQAYRECVEQELDQMRNQFADVKVPLELLDVLDQGKNPQLYTKEVLERTLQKNKEVNGKVETYKKFHAALLKELGEEMPEDTMTYRNIRDILDK
ncbi:hypothetical protein ANCCEY_14886 [Ancylostoma ceylanicum]|uniref:Mediator of RNA polymerase II transcription subunit 10 n=1 Tax=Ancylostoma ceylanicum TaxID=53326 RepID=A0A0D6L5R2_9BILA|nr:hypothetical protein ANCCEY_14886 [Ancylostoma ceylanicum]